MKYFLIIFSSILIGNVQAQKSKIAYINTNKLWELMPEKKKADSILTVYQQQLSTYLNQMMKEYQTKLEVLQKDTTMARESWMFKEKVNELNTLEDKIKASKEKAQKDMLTKKDKLYGPIREKMQQAIDKVAEDQDYEYVLDTSFGNIIYRKSERYNILPLVKNELNIQ